MGVGYSAPETHYDEALTEAQVSKYDAVVTLLQNVHDNVGSHHDAPLFFDFAKRTVDVWKQDATHAIITAVAFVMFPRAGVDTVPHDLLVSHLRFVRPEYTKLLNTPFDDWHTLRFPDDNYMATRVARVLQEWHAVHGTGVHLTQFTPTARLAVTATAFVFVINFSPADVQQSAFARVIPIIMGGTAPPPPTPPPTHADRDAAYVTPPPSPRPAAPPATPHPDAAVDIDDHELVADAEQQGWKLAFCLPPLQPYEPLVHELLRCPVTRRVVATENTVNALQTAAMAFLTGNDAGGATIVRTLARDNDVTLQDTPDGTRHVLHAFFYALAQRCTPAQPHIDRDMVPMDATSVAVAARWAAFIADARSMGDHIAHLETTISELQGRLAHSDASDAEVERLAAQVKLQAAVREQERVDAGERLADLQTQLDLSRTELTAAQEETKGMLHRIHDAQVELDDARAKMASMQRFIDAVAATGASVDSVEAFRAQFEAVEREKEALVAKVEELRAQTGNAEALGVLEPKLAAAELASDVMGTMLATANAAEIEDLMRHNTHLEAALHEMNEYKAAWMSESIVKQQGIDKLEIMVSQLKAELKKSQAQMEVMVSRLTHMVVPTLLDEGRVVLKPPPHITFDDVSTWKLRVQASLQAVALYLENKLQRMLRASADSQKRMLADDVQSIQRIKEAVNHHGLTLSSLVDYAFQLAAVVRRHTHVAQRNAVGKRVEALGSVAKTLFDMEPTLFSQRTMQQVNEVVTHGVDGLTSAEEAVAHDMLKEALETGLTALKLEFMQEGSPRVATVDALLAVLQSPPSAPTPSQDRLRELLTELGEV